MGEVSSDRRSKELHPAIPALGEGAAQIPWDRCLTGIPPASLKALRPPKGSPDGARQPKHNIKVSENKSRTDQPGYRAPGADPWTFPAPRKMLPCSLRREFELEPAYLLFHLAATSLWRPYFCEIPSIFP